MGAPEDLRANIKAYEAMQEELEERHPRKHVVFHDRKFADAFDSFHEAASQAVLRFGNGPYLTRQVGGTRAMRLPASVALQQYRASS